MKRRSRARFVDGGPFEARRAAPGAINCPPTHTHRGSEVSVTAVRVSWGQPSLPEASHVVRVCARSGSWGALAETHVPGPAVLPPLGVGQPADPCFRPPAAITLCRSRLPAPLSTCPTGRPACGGGDLSAVFGVRFGSPAPALPCARHSEVLSEQMNECPSREPMNG